MHTIKATKYCTRAEEKYISENPGPPSGIAATAQGRIRRTFENLCCCLFLVYRPCHHGCHPCPFHHPSFGHNPHHSLPTPHPRRASCSLAPLAHQGCRVLPQ